MNTPDLNLTSWCPSYHPTGCLNVVGGGIKQVREEFHTVVEVFTYWGGEHGPAFTKLETYLCGRRYQARLPRAYSTRWFGRLARQFDWACWHDAGERGNR